MIRCTGLTEEMLVSAGRGNWLQKAARHTQQNRMNGANVSADNIWSEIKQLLLRQQYRKCAFCERLLDKEGVASDVDHYRPKNRVDKWPGVDGEDIDVGGSSTNGYYLLAFDFRNYLATCKPCNSTYKAAYFPTERPRQLTTEDITVLRDEQPLLINPLSDPDPQHLISWSGVIPTPSDDCDEQSRRRAWATIELLKLAREDLVRSRTHVLVGVWTAYRLLVITEGRDRYAAQSLNLYCRADSPHTACAQAFRQLCMTQPEAAEAHIALLLS